MSVILGSRCDSPFSMHDRGHQFRIFSNGFPCSLSIVPDLFQGLKHPVGMERGFQVIVHIFHGVAFRGTGRGMKERKIGGDFQFPLSVPCCPVQNNHAMMVLLDGSTDGCKMLVHLRAVRLRTRMCGFQMVLGTGC